MTTFKYTAAKPTGKVLVGVVEAANLATAKLELRARGLTPISIEEASHAGGETARAWALRLTSQQTALSTKSLAIVARQLATLLNANLRVDEALAAVAGGNPPRVATVLLNVRKQVQEGKTLAQALRAYPESFPQLFVESVTAGEQAGNVGKVIEQLAHYLELNVQNRQTVKLALIYPCLLAVVSFLIIMVLLIFVIPDIVRVFTERGAALPFITRALIETSSFASIWGLWVIAAGLIAAFVFTRWKRKPSNRLRLHRAIAIFPVSARLSQATNGAQLCSILSTLLGSGVPLVDALKVAAVTLPNLYFKASVDRIVELVRKGDSFSRAMREVQVFSPLLVAMVTSGESSGRLAETLGHSAREQQKSLEALVKTVVGLVEPAILLLMGGIVLLMVMAILLPIISMNTLSGL